MYRREHRDQLSFKDFFLPFGGQLGLPRVWWTGRKGKRHDHQTFD